MIGESHVARLITAMKDENRGMDGEKQGLERGAGQATAGRRKEKGHSEEWPKSLHLMVGQEDSNFRPMPPTRRHQAVSRMDAP